MTLYCTLTAEGSGDTIHHRLDGIRLKKGLNPVTAASWTATDSVIQEDMRELYQSAALPEYAYTANMLLSDGRKMLCSERWTFKPGTKHVWVREGKDTSYITLREGAPDSVSVVFHVSGRDSVTGLKKGDSLYFNTGVDSLGVRFGSAVLWRQRLEKQALPTGGFVLPMKAPGAGWKFVPKKVKVFEPGKTTIAVNGFLADSAMPYSGFGYPYFTTQVQGGFKVFGLPFKAAFFAINQRLQSPEEMMRSPLTYFNVSFDANAFMQDTRVETRDINFRNDVLSQEQLLDKQRQRLEHSLDSIRLGYAKPGIEFDTGLVPDPDSLPADTTAMDYSRRDLRRINRLQNRLDGLYADLAEVQRFRKRIEKLPGDKSELPMRDVPQSLQKSAFGQLPGIRRFRNVKNLSVGVVYPKRPVTGLNTNGSLELWGITTELQIKDRVSYYLLYGKSRDLPFYAPNIRVLENGLTYSDQKYTVSLLVSHERSNSLWSLVRPAPATPVEASVYDGGTSQTNYLADARYRLHKNLEVGLATMVNASTIKQPFGLFNQQETVYANVLIGKAQGKVYATYTPQAFFTELDRTWMPNTLRTGSEVSIPFFRDKLRTMAGYELMQTPFAADSTNEVQQHLNKSHAFKFSVSTAFSKAPNLSVSYTPFSGASSSFDQQRAEVMVLTAQTSIWVASLTYNTIAGNSRLTSVLSFQEVKNSIVYDLESGSTSRATDIKNLFGTLNLAHRKNSLNIYLSKRWKDAFTDEIARAAYKRDITDHIALGGAGVAAEQNARQFYSAQALAEYKLKRFVMEAGAGRLFYVNSRSYSIATVGMRYSVF